MEEAKRAAGRAAVEDVRSGMRLGLGTGSTVRHFLEALGEALEEGRLQDVAGVPTSEDTARRARSLGIQLGDLHELAPLDLAVDGADEVDPRLDLIKGLGGALLREKMVVQAARRFLVVVGVEKEVDRLGARAPLPVEVIPFGWEAHLPFFRELGGEPRLRGGAGDPYRTDNGNLIVDLEFPAGMDEPEEVEAALQQRAGVVESGLFLGVAGALILGEEDGSVRRRFRGPKGGVSL